MLEALGRFARRKHLRQAEALAVLRGLFAALFGAQVAAAFLLGSLVRLLAGPQGPAHPLLSQSLALLAGLQLPLALFLSLAASRQATRESALYGALLAGALLATPAWFLAFALLAGSGPLYLFLLLVLLLLAYALGFGLCGRFARYAALAAPSVRPRDAATAAATAPESGLGEQLERQIEADEPVGGVHDLADAQVASNARE